MTSAPTADTLQDALKEIDRLRGIIRASCASHLHQDEFGITYPWAPFTTWVCAHCGGIFDNWNVGSGNTEPKALDYVPGLTYIG